MFKRNFTYGLAFPANANDGNAWGLQPFQQYTSSTSKPPFTSSDATTVLCAMNIFGQSDIYKYGSYNGLCINPNKKHYRSGYGNTPSWVRCKVTFAGSNGPAKRSIGSPGDWEIESMLSWTITEHPYADFDIGVEIEEDAEPEGYLPSGVDLGEEVLATIVPRSGAKAGLVDLAS